jgi:hypothetical protein
LIFSSHFGFPQVIFEREVVRHCLNSEKIHE